MTIEISSDGKVIGKLTADQFRQSFGCPKSVFLPECVARFNARKQQAGEPERAAIAIR